MTTIRQQLTQLETFGLLRLAQPPPELEYLFRHPLIQDAAYSTVLRGDRKRIHLAAGEALEGQYPERLDDLAPLLAQHFLEAGDHRALPYFRRAGDHALAAYANQEALQHYQAALALETDPRGRAGLLAGMGEAWARQGHFAEAIRVWQEAIPLFAGDPDRVAGLYSRAAWAAWHADDRPRSLALGREGLATVGTASSSPGLAALLHETARACYFNGAPGEARTLGRQALAMAEALGALDVQAEALVTLSLLPDLSAAEKLATLTRAAAMAEAAGLFIVAARAHNNMGSGLLAEGQLQIARDHYLQAATLVRRAGTPYWEFWLLNGLVSVSLLLGDLAAAGPLLPRLGTLLQESGAPEHGVFLLRLTEAAVCIYRGQDTAALAILRPCQLEARQRGNLQELLDTNLTLARVLIAQGGWDEAAAALEEALAIGDRGLGGAIESRSLLAAVYARQGRPEDAQALLDAAHARAGPPPSPVDARWLALGTARVALATGRLSEALAAFAVVAATEGQLGMRREQASTLREWAQAHLAAGTDR